MSPQFTDDDVGKSVVNANGDEVGIIADVEHGTAHVEPDPGITDTIKAKLGWGGSDEDTYPLQEGSVARVTNDEVHLEHDLSGGGVTGTGRTTDMDREATGSDTGTGTTDTGTDRRSDDDLLGDDDDDLLGDDTRNR
ncbi:hypothetical protein [Halosolutus gelatinilyticus]|uniref:hypothetical protein n=1 Tax=Halosolutus gelatinilyticus TaxID=2931975 RepID=UPI001FF13883|nr:hypothetical protein [Halosolutus gelatinilyticus]